jgi:TRAP-type mannitol/chloroaromatic compound transport system permease small subunit
MLPWALFLTWTAVPAVWQSLMHWERFPETLNPGYFMIKVALLLLALLMAWQALSDLLRLRT